MGKLKKRKDDNTLGKQMPSYYEINKINKEIAEKALEEARKQNKPVKYLIKK